MNVLPERRVFPLVSYPVVMKTRLPDFWVETQLPFCPKRKPSFNELQAALESLHWSDEQMKVVGHDHKLVKKILALLAVAKQNINQQLQQMYQQRMQQIQQDRQSSGRQ